MVTRRAVLKGTAAASIGAIAAAHGAAPVEAFCLDAGYGQLTGGAIGAFYKFRNAFQIALKFDKLAADIVLKEEEGGLAIFYKFFDKANAWSEIIREEIQSKHFVDLKTSELYFSKIETDGAQLFLKEQGDVTFNFSKIEVNFGVSTDGVYFNQNEVSPPPPEID